MRTYLRFGCKKDSEELHLQYFLTTIWLFHGQLLAILEGQPH